MIITVTLLLAKEVINNCMLPNQEYKVENWAYKIYYFLCINCKMYLK